MAIMLDGPTEPVLEDLHLLARCVGRKVTRPFLGERPNDLQDALVPLDATTPQHRRSVPNERYAEVRLNFGDVPNIPAQKSQDVGSTPDVHLAR